MEYVLVKTLHVIASTILFGTGIGSAFYMLLASLQRDATVALIAHLAELDARRLYLAEGCASLFAYCTQVLHLSEHAAYGRIEAAHPGLAPRPGGGERADVQLIDDLSVRAQPAPVVVAPGVGVRIDDGGEPVRTVGLQS